MSGGGGLGFLSGITRTPERDYVQQPQNNGGEGVGVRVAGRQERLLPGR